MDRSGHPTAEQGATMTSADALRTLAHGGLRSPRFATHWQRAGIYLLLTGTADRAAKYAAGVDDDGAFDLLAQLPIDDLDVACADANARIGHDRPDPIAGAFTMTRREPMHPRVRKSRKARRMPLQAEPHRHGGPQRRESCSPPDGRIVRKPHERERLEARTTFESAKRMARRATEPGRNAAAWRRQAHRLLVSAIRRRERARHLETLAQNDATLGQTTLR
jgi:hypothetical protein